jgi:hypothetical protein
MKNSLCMFFVVNVLHKCLASGAQGLNPEPQL